MSQSATPAPQPPVCDLSVRFCGLQFKNPIIAASGTFGYGVEFEDIVTLEKLGGFLPPGEGGGVRGEGALARADGRQSSAARLRDRRRHAQFHRAAEHRR